MVDFIMSVIDFIGFSIVLQLPQCGHSTPLDGRQITPS